MQPVLRKVQIGYVKSNLTKHMKPKFFYAHEYHKTNVIKVLHTVSFDNLTDLYTIHYRHPFLRDASRGSGCWDVEKCKIQE